MKGEVQGESVRSCARESKYMALPSRRRRRPCSGNGTRENVSIEIRLRDYRAICLVTSTGTEVAISNDSGVCRQSICTCRGALRLACHLV